MGRVSAVDVCNGNMSKSSSLCFEGGYPEKGIMIKIDEKTFSDFCCWSPPKSCFVH